MNVATETVRVLPFLREVLERDGGAVEMLGLDQAVVVLPSALRDELELPSCATIDVSGAPGDGVVPFPLEGAGMQWVLDRVRERGRLAGARLGCPPQNPSGRLAKARALLSLPNTKIAHAEAMRLGATRALLEFGYAARSEERTDGRVYVAVTEGGRTSFVLARRLLEHLGGAVPEAPALDEAALGRHVDAAAGRVEAEVRHRLEPFCAASRERMAVEERRIVAYYERLAREAGRRRGRARADAETVASKREAILRQRAERLDDLAERHAVAATWWPASALVLRYEVTLCRFRLLRRRREVLVDVEWDPFLGDFLGPGCAACDEATTYLHVCDAEGHVTCASCAARCEACGRVTCRACQARGCGCDAAARETGA